MQAGKCSNHFQFVLFCFVLFAPYTHTFKELESSYSSLLIIALILLAMLPSLNMAVIVGINCSFAFRNARWSSECEFLEK